MLKLKKLPTRNLIKYESLTPKRLIFPKQQQQQVRKIFLNQNKNNNKKIIKFIRKKSDKNNEDGGDKKHPDNKLIYIIIGTAIFFYIEYNYFSKNNPALNVREITMEQFFQLVDSKSLEEVIFNPNSNKMEVRVTSAPMLQDNGSFPTNVSSSFFLLIYFFFFCKVKSNLLF